MFASGGHEPDTSPAERLAEVGQILALRLMRTLGSPVDHLPTAADKRAIGPSEAEGGVEGDTVVGRAENRKEKSPETRRYARPKPARVALTGHWPQAPLRTKRKS